MIRFFIFFLLFTSLLFAQSNVDSLRKSSYLEDQIYVGFSYILLNRTSKEIDQRGFSNSLNFGFIKDIPMNNEGSFAVGIGLGYGRNTYFQNVRIYKDQGVTYFTILDDNFEFKTNKFSTHNIEIPIEIRWRTSTVRKYKFWRLYAGGKFSYAFATNAKLKLTDEKEKLKGIEQINDFQFGLTLAVGYGTWNFNIYYGLTNIFSDAFLHEVTPLKMQDIRVGLIFYIL